MQTFERADVGLAWGVKDSFVRYVEGMSDGRVLLGEGASATATGQFYFPFASAEHTDDGRQTLLFSGAVRFLGHFGFMSVTLRNPAIEIGPVAVMLSVDQGGERLCLAELAFPSKIVENGIMMWQNVGATLAAAGVTTFGDNYPAGESLAPLTVRAPFTRP